MKKYIFFSVLSLVFVLAGCGGQEDKAIVESPKIINECQAEGDCAEFISETLSPEDFKEKLDSGEYDMIDIRTHEEYMNERIADVPNIDIYKDDFNDKLNDLDKEKKYLIYCRSGNRTKMRLNRMKAFGFTQVYDLDGGIEAWKDSGFAVIE